MVIYKQDTFQLAHSFEFSKSKVCVCVGGGISGEGFLSGERNRVARRNAKAGKKGLSSRT